MKRLVPADVRLGMPLPFSVFDKDGRLLLRKGVVISYQHQLERLVANGLFAAEGAAASTAPAHPVVGQPQPVFDEIGSLTLRLKTLFTDLLGAAPSDDTRERVIAMAREIHAACARDAEGAIAAIHLDFHNPYLLSHHVHAAVLCALLGERLGMADAELTPLMCAALTFDIGLVDMLHLEKQPDALSEEQNETMRRHPQTSVTRLKRAGVDNEIWLAAVSSHHERINGSGYPHGLHRDELPPGARLLGLVDIYTAMIKGRSYRAAKVPLKAIAEIMQGKETQFDASSCDTLVKELGMYPPGALVRLANGEVAVVKERGAKIHEPQVHSVYDKAGMPLMSPRQRDSRLEEFAVKAPVAHSECRAVALIIRRLWTK
ncbi:MAG: HD domain-containing protein [Sulfuricella sp.]|nr:HD domain-containing protein [Sulfuricella sp.]